MPDHPTHRLADLIAQASRDGTPVRRIAAAIDVDASTLFRWKTGQSAIPSDKIPALASYFNVDPVWLMGWDRPGDEDREPNGAAA